MAVFKKKNANTESEAHRVINSQRLPSQQDGYTLDTLSYTQYQSLDMILSGNLFKDIEYDFHRHYSFVPESPGEVMRDFTEQLIRTAERKEENFYVAADYITEELKASITKAIKSIRDGNRKITDDNSIYSDNNKSDEVSVQMVHTGSALYSYTKGIIAEKALSEELADSAVSVAISVFYTRAVKEVFDKKAGVLLPFAVYTAANLVYSCTKEIIRNAVLETSELNRITAMNLEAARCIREQTKLMNQAAQLFADNQKHVMNELISQMNYDPVTGKGYQTTVEAIIRFADAMGLAIEYADFEEFSEAMRNKQIFFLG